MNPDLINFIYLLSAILFILGIKGLTKPKTAVRGNMLSALGMLVAVVVTLTTINDVDFTYVVAGVIVGGIIGGVMALKVQMTSMPQMVALLNGFGGGASLTIALAEYATRVGMAPTSLYGFFEPVSVSSSVFGDGLVGTIAILSIGLTVLIGAVTLTGSLVAFGKLQELIKKSRGLPGGPIGNGLMLAGALFSVYLLVNNPGDVAAMGAILSLALLLGLFLVMPIGGADMPVVVSMLNSYSGWAAAAAGFLLGNNLLIVTGALVGSSGAILSYIMCRAMNRSFISVIAGGFGNDPIASDDEEEGDKNSLVEAVEENKNELFNTFIP